MMNEGGRENKTKQGEHGKMLSFQPHSMCNAENHR
jgi:hypothetical protein